MAIIWVSLSTWFCLNILLNFSQKMKGVIHHYYYFMHF